LDEPSSVERLWEEFKLKASSRSTRSRGSRARSPTGCGHRLDPRSSGSRPARSRRLLSVGSERGGRLSLVDTLEDKGAEDPVAVFESQEMKGILAGAINRLGERGKIVIPLYYYEGLTLAEIGQVLGVAESRVCQMHTKAVLQLRRRCRTR
jgi:RNA polymerase sigma factor FliA